MVRLLKCTQYLLLGVGPPSPQVWGHRRGFRQLGHHQLGSGPRWVFVLTEKASPVEAFVLSSVEAFILSYVEAFILSSVEAFNSPLEMRRRCHVSLLRRARNHISRTPGQPETALGPFEVMPH